MQIQHNIMAMNAYRNYASNTSALSKNLEKLSSGYKINRAGDDAAGLAISEKMRAQITGLNTAQDNAKSGINLVQTAEGSMTEVHDMLNRMVELSDQSANGTYDDGTDRANLQKEVTQLKSEINRIADSSNFNGIKLLDGSLGGASSDTISISGTLNGSAIAAGAEVAAQSQVFTTGTVAQSGSAGSNATTVTVIYTDTTGATQTKDVSFDSGTSAANSESSLITALNGDSDLGALFTAADASGKITLTSKTPGTEGGGVIGLLVKDAGTDGVSIPAGTLTTAASDAHVEYNLSNIGSLTAGDSLTIDGRTYTASSDSSVDGSDGKTFKDWATLVTAAAQNGVKLTDISTGGDQSAVTAEPTEKGLTLQIGDTSDSFNKLKVSIQDMHADSLGIGNIDISSQSGASAATDLIKTAINTVSSVRGTLGATQNRLEHTINNLSTMTENIQDAESSIRDTDVAEEMMSYTKNNILVQSAQAMLAQANQVPQGVLQLLQ